jgi:hypothetical protein
MACLDGRLREFDATDNRETGDPDALSLERNSGSSLSTFTDRHTAFHADGQRLVYPEMAEIRGALAAR